MSQDLLPLFPLGVVLFPGGLLPLHIFEPRYQEMIGEVIRTEGEFGVVLAEEKSIAQSGCTAAVETVVNRYPDGRMDILTRGRRRFTIASLDQEKAYLRAAVEFFDDDEFDPVPPETRRQVIEAHRILNPDVEEHPDLQDPLLSFRLAEAVTETRARQNLIEIRSEAGRMRFLADFLPDYAVRQRRIEHVRAVAPKNGHGHMPDVQ